MDALDREIHMLANMLIIVFRLFIATIDKAPGDTPLMHDCATLCTIACSNPGMLWWSARRSWTRLTRST